MVVRPSIFAVSAVVTALAVEPATATITLQAVALTSMHAHFIVASIHQVRDVVVVMGSRIAIRRWTPAACVAATAPPA